MPTVPTETKPKRLVAGPYLQPLLEAAAARGISAAQLRHAAGLDVALEPMPESISAHSYERLLELAAELGDDPDFGLHTGERVKLGTYNVYGLIILSCRDFGQALQQTMRFESLAHDLGCSTLEVQGGLAEYRWQPNNAAAGRHLAESVFAGIRVFADWLAGQPLPAAAISFTHAAPPDTSEHVRIFGNQISFNAGVNSARFDATLLAMPVPNADIGMYPVLQQHAERLLQEKARAEADGGIAALVCGSIARRLAQDGARVADVAQDLDMSLRTLQRKLTEAGCTFGQLLDSTRRELAERYLTEGHFGIAEIAFMLGYREQSSFNHAFKEWTGKNPGAYRAANKKAS